jgi:hypothetical protein
VLVLVLVLVLVFVVEGMVWIRHVVMEEVNVP